MRLSRGHRHTLKGSRARGFTLLEIVVVLTLGALIIGGALGYLAFSSKERHLRESSGEIEILAKKARTVAMLQQTTYALVIKYDGVHLMPLAEAIQEPVGRIGKKTDQNIIADNPRFTPVHGDWVPDEEDRIGVKRWASDTWNVLDDRAPAQIWRFEPDGICEPVTLRIQNGNSFIETEYHPLSATVLYRTLEARK